jgi:hypothetical protein
MLKAETGESLSSTNVQRDKELNALIDSKQKWLAVEKAWPFLERRVDTAMVAGTRYYNLPTTINFERPCTVEVLFTTVWQPVNYGISSTELNVWNSDNAVRSDPVQRWSFYHPPGFDPSTDQHQCEVWPIPVTNTTLRFTGQGNLTTLGTGTTWTDAAKLDLDDVLVVLFCAAEILARKNQKDAELKQRLATERLSYLAGNYPKRTQVVTMGGVGREQEIKLRSLVLVS